MDDLCLLREAVEEPPPLTAAARTAARGKLFDAIGGEGGRGRTAMPSRRTAFRIAVAASVAAGAGTAVMTAASRGKGAPADAAGASRAPRMELTAAQVLDRAARRTLAEDALPIPRNDQYIYSRTFTAVTPLNGGKVRTWTDENWYSVDGTKPSRTSLRGKVRDHPPLAANERYEFPLEYAELQKWPTDPDGIVDRLTFGGQTHYSSNDPVPNERERVIYFRACYFMQWPRVMPPGLEAGLFHVLERLPGLRADHHGTDAHGRRGIAVSLPNAGASFVFDARTYDFLGMRSPFSEDKVVDGEIVSRRVGTQVTSREEVGVVDRIGQRP